jgi:hypothetical protein
VDTLKACDLAKRGADLWDCLTEVLHNMPAFLAFSPEEQAAVKSVVWHEIRNDRPNFPGPAVRPAPHPTSEDTLFDIGPLAPPRPDAIKTPKLATTSLLEEANIAAQAAFLAVSAIEKAENRADALTKAATGNERPTLEQVEVSRQASAMIMEQYQFRKLETTIAKISDDTGETRSLIHELIQRSGLRERWLAENLTVLVRGKRGTVSTLRARIGALRDDLVKQRAALACVRSGDFDRESVERGIDESEKHLRRLKICAKCLPILLVQLASQIKGSKPSKLKSDLIAALWSMNGSVNFGPSRKFTRKLAAELTTEIIGGLFPTTNSSVETIRSESFRTIPRWNPSTTERNKPAKKRLRKSR